jgi:hypothetical protein
VVPVLANPFDDRDETLQVVLSNATPAGEVLLGTPGTATLTIRDIDPNPAPLSVSGVHWSGTNRDIRQVFVTFTKPLGAAAVNPAGFALVNIGQDGRFGTRDDRGVRIAAASYDPSTLTVTLTPNRPLPLNRFFRLVVKGATPGGLIDYSGDKLAGDGANPGTDYTAMLARGTNLKYIDRDGDTINLRLSRGGAMDDLLDGTGQGRQLTIVGAAPRRTTLSGSIRKARRGDGRTYLGPAIGGLGSFGDVKVRLNFRRFLVDRLPYTGSRSVKSS